MNNTKCWFCQTGTMIWSGDFDFEDYGIEGDGIIACLQCSNDDCGASAEFYTKINE